MRSDVKNCNKWEWNEQNTIKYVNKVLKNVNYLLCWIDYAKQALVNQKINKK